MQVRSARRPVRSARPACNARKRLQRTLCVAGTVAFAAAGAGCGATSSQPEAASAPQSDAAAKLVEEASGPQTFKPPGPAFDAAQAKGKTAWLIGEDLKTPFNGLVAKGWSEALELAGVKPTLFDSKGQISEMARGMSLAIAAKTDVIVWAGVKFELLRPQLDAAYKAHIPVIDMFGYSPEQWPPADVPKAVVALASHSYTQAGKMMADYISADAHGQGHPGVILITSSDIGVQAGQEAAAFTAELHKLCPNCSLTTKDVQVAQWSTLGHLTSSLILANPGVKYLVPLFDGEALYMIPAVHTAGAQNKVQIVSFNGTPAALEALAAKNVMGADVGVVNLAQGWGIADQTLRVLTGTEPVANINAPLRLFTRSSVRDVDLKAQESTWYGDNDYSAIYKQLWKLN